MSFESLLNMTCTLRTPGTATNDLGETTGAPTDVTGVACAFQLPGRSVAKKAQEHMGSEVVTTDPRLYLAYGTAITESTTVINITNADGTVLAASAQVERVDHDVAGRQHHVLAILRDVKAPGA